MILYLISELDVGGAEKSLFHLATGLDARFGRPAVACLWGRGRLGQWLQDAGIEVIHLHGHRVGLLAAAFHLRKMLKSGRFTLLHTFLFHANIAGRLAAAGTGVPVISSIRVTETDRPFRVTIDRLTSRRVVAETCVAEAVRQWSIQHGLPADKLITIPNGIDCPASQPSPARIKDDLGLPDGARLALFIGRLHRQKGPDVLLQAARILCPQMPNAHFVLAGDGPLEGSIRRHAERYGLAGHFHLLGRRDDVPALLAVADLLVLPSRWEGMPNAVLEAMAAGRPAVAANVGGCPELIIDGQTGLLVPPENPDALAEAIRRLLSDATLAARMGQAARRRAEQEFSIEKMVRRNEELYDRFLKR